jgi:hypothetical protein
MLAIARYVAGQRGNGLWPPVLPTLKEMVVLMNLGSTNTALNRIRSLVREGYMGCWKRDNGTVCIYLLTEKGEQWIKNAIGGMDGGGGYGDSSVSRSDYGLGSGRDDMAVGPGQRGEEEAG